MSIVEPNGGADVPEIPDGLYLAEVTAVKDITLEQPDNFGNTEKVELDIAFTDADGVAQTLQPRVNRKWGEKANLFLIAIACGIYADPDAFFDTDYLVGRKVNVLVETPEEGRWPRVTTWTRVRTGKANGAAPAKANGVNESDPDFDAFWKRVKAGGFDRKEVAPYVDGDLTRIVSQTQDQLDKILLDMGV